MQTSNISAGICVRVQDLEIVYRWEEVLRTRILFILCHWGQQQQRLTWRMQSWKTTLNIIHVKYNWPMKIAVIIKRTNQITLSNNPFQRLCLSKYQSLYCTTPTVFLRHLTKRVAIMMRHHLVISSGNC